MTRRSLVLLMVPGMALLSGCAVVKMASDAGAAIGQATGAMTPGQAASLKRSGEAVAKAGEKITPEQEYYIGRAVAATILKTYKPYDNAAANQYVNLLGQSLASVSDKPETFRGYHFLVMDTDEVNAFAAPGGLILVSRGLIRCCPTEDALAAVLAHEVAHVQFEHGLKAIKKGRVTSALTILAAEGAKNLGGEQLAELTTAFEGTIGDITSTLVNSGYARTLEMEADKAAVTIMGRLGYDPHGLVTMLTSMKARMQGTDHKGFGATHPTPDQRIEALRTVVTGAPAAEPEIRTARLQKALGGI